MLPPFMYLGQSSASFLHDWKTSLDSKLEKNWRGIGWETEDFVTLFSDWPPLLNISCSLTWSFFLFLFFASVTVCSFVCFFVFFLNKNKLTRDQLLAQSECFIFFNLIINYFFSSFTVSSFLFLCLSIFLTRIEIGFLPSLNISGPIAILQLTPSLLFRLGEYVSVKSLQLALFILSWKIKSSYSLLTFQYHPSPHDHHHQQQQQYYYPHDHHHDHHYHPHEKERSKSGRKTGRSEANDPCIKIDIDCCLCYIVMMMMISVLNKYVHQDRYRLLPLAHCDDDDDVGNDDDDVMWLWWLQFYASK